MSSKLTIKTLIEPVNNIMWQCGEILNSNFGSTLSVEYKNNRKSDPVTQIDKQLQSLIINSISKLFPEHNFLGEEQDDESTYNQTESDYMWIIDPLDGTTNYINGLPLFGSSVGLLYKGTVIAGWIYIPWPNKENGLVISSLTDSGCFVNQTQIHNDPLEATESSKLIGLPGFFLSNHRFTGPMSNSFGEPRGTGSIAYECCLCALGSTQYSIFGGPKLWDIAGGISIIKESGGESIMKESNKSPWSKTDPLLPNWDPSPSYVSNLKTWSNSVIVSRSGLSTYITKNMVSKQKVIKKIGTLFN
jgi:myo-inositol-1(or 4)-monophosphatase